MNLIDRWRVLNTLLNINKPFDLSQNMKLSLETRFRFSLTYFLQSGLKAPSTYHKVFLPTKPINKLVDEDADNGPIAMSNNCRYVLLLDLKVFLSTTRRVALVIKTLSKLFYRSFVFLYPVSKVWGTPTPIKIGDGKASKYSTFWNRRWNVLEENYAIPYIVGYLWA